MAPRCPKVAPRWPKDGAKMAPRWRQEGPNRAPRRLQVASHRDLMLHYLRLASDSSPKTSQDRPRHPPGPPRDLPGPPGRAQDGSEKAPKWPQHFCSRCLTPAAAGTRLYAVLRPLLLGPLARADYMSADCVRKSTQLLDTIAERRRRHNIATINAESTAYYSQVNGGGR